MRADSDVFPGKAAFALSLLAAAACTAVGPAEWPLQLEAEPVSFTMPVPERIQQAAQGASASDPLRPICYLRFQQVDLKPGRSAQLRVFINSPQASIATSTQSAGYAGFLVVSPPAAAHGSSQPLNLTMDVTARLAPALRDDEVTFTLVPLGEPGGTIEGLNLQIGEVRFFLP